jgi:hypothetical protein
MLTSISPLGERARGNRWAVTATAYVVGSIAGGAAVGALLGGVGDLLLGRPLPLVAAAVCLLAALADLLGLLPRGSRQVDEDWLVRYRGWVYGLAFGAQLGVGFATIVTSAATFAVLALELLTASPVAGLLVGAAFGLARALPLLGLRRATTPEALRATAARVEDLGRAAARTTTVTLGVAALALVAA